MPGTYHTIWHGMAWHGVHKKYCAAKVWIWTDISFDSIQFNRILAKKFSVCLPRPCYQYVFRRRQKRLLLLLFLLLSRRCRRQSRRRLTFFVPLFLCCVSIFSLPSRKCCVFIGLRFYSLFISREMNKKNIRAAQLPDWFEVVTRE